jgi:pimeloyl-ACP methyl ester carboxylesterase
VNRLHRLGSSEYLKLLGYKRYHYLVWPGVSSTRLVLLHGRGESADIWTGFANQFIHRADTIALDLRGHGGTPWDPDLAYGFNDLVDDLRLQLEHWKRKSILIAHGLGGRIALAAALRLPDLIQALVLIDTDMKAETPGLLVEKLSSESRAGFSRNSRLSEGVDWEALYRSLTWARLGGDRIPKCDPAVLETFESSPLWDQAASLTQPALVLRSGGVVRTSSDDVERIDGTFPRWRLDHVIAGSWPHIQDPVEVADAVKRFLDEVEPRP